jgi:hypothetical protein
MPTTEAATIHANLLRFVKRCYYNNSNLNLPQRHKVRYGIQMSLCGLCAFAVVAARLNFTGNVIVELII